MNPPAHKVSGRIINQSMTGDCVLAHKDWGDDVELVVAAILGAGMAGMAMRLVLYHDGLGLQDSKPLAQQFNGVAAHAGRAFLNGLTVTVA